MNTNKHEEIEKSPWDWKVIVPISLLVNFGAGGIIAGINWRRMGKDHLAWPTIIISILGFIAWRLVPWAKLLPEPSSAGSMQLGVGGVAGWLLWSWQKKTYEAWKDSHSEAKPAGWSVPLLVFVIFLVIQLLLWAPSILARQKAVSLIEWSTYENPSRGFRILYPSNWQKQEFDLGSSFNLKLVPPAGFWRSSRCSVNVTIAQSQLPEDAESYLELVQASLPELTDLKALDYTNTTCAGLPAKEIVFTGKVGDRVFKAMQVVSNRLTLGYMAPVHEYPEHLEQAKKMLNSLRIEWAPSILARQKGADYIILADSSSEFSGTQGQDNWYYGYYDGDGPAPYRNADFEQLPRHEINAWGDLNWYIDGYWTGLCHYGGHPNGWPEHWVVRRWVSEVSGRITITGLLAKHDSRSGNGVTGYILVDGVRAWSQSIGYNDMVGVKYSINLDVNIGSLVDFAIGPNGNDSCDNSRFTATIAYISYEAAIIYVDKDANGANDGSS